MGLFFRFIFFASSVFWVSSTFGQQSGPPAIREEMGMKNELETIYTNWRSAMIRKDLRAWEASVASYRKIGTRNRIISNKHPFPAALFDDQAAPPTLENLILMTIFTRRDTASAVYFGKPNFGPVDPKKVTDVLMVLRYVKEQGKWYFDNTRIVKIDEDKSILFKIRNRDLSFLNAEEFRPLEKVPPTPPLVGQPELLGEIWATSIGYETEIWVNNFPIGTIKNGGGKEIVMGGVKRGNNVFRFKTKKLDGVKEAPKLEFAIYAAKGPGEKANRLMHYGPVAMPESNEFALNFTGRVIKIE